MNTKYLQQVLTSVKPGLARRDVIEQATHFIFTGIEIVSYNDSICISHPCEVGFRGSVKAQDLFRIVCGIADDEVELKAGKKNLKISSKKTKASLAMLAEGAGEVETMIEALEADRAEIEWNPLPSDFIEGLSLCLFSAARNLSQLELNAVYVKGMSIYATDNYRVSQFEMSGDVEPMLIPLSSVEELIKFPLVEYCITEAWVHFRTEEEVLFCCRKLPIEIEAEFPDCADAFSDVIEEDGIKLPDGLKEAVDSCTPLAASDKDLDKLIEFKIKEGSIMCKASHTRGWIEQTVEIEGDVEFSFEINPIFLSQILQKTTVMIAMEDKAVFTSGNFKHAISLMVDE